MARRRGRIKFGNILLLLALVGVGYYFFNRDAVDGKLRDFGLEVPGAKPSPAPDDAKPNEPEGAADPQASGEGEGDASDLESQGGEEGDAGNPSGVGGEAQAYISSQNEGNKLLVMQANPILVQAEGFEGKDLRPMIDSPQNAVLITRNQAAGEYSVRVPQAGEVVFTVMGKRNGKLDVIGTQTLLAVSEADGKRQPGESGGVGGFAVEVAGLNGKLLYLGVENPIEVKVEGVESGDIRLECEDVRNTVKHGQGYAIKPKNAGEVQLQVYAIVDGKEQLAGTETFVAVELPQPQVTLAGKSAGDISGSVLKAAKGLDAVLPKVELPGAGCRILGFTLKRYAKTGNYEPVENKGGEFGKEVLQHLSEAAGDDLFLFSGVVVQTPDGVRHKLPDQAFVVR